MSELETQDVESAVYRLDDKSQQVSTAKSQFAEEHDLDYSNVKGKVLFNRGTGWGKHPKFVAVAEIPE